MFNKLSSQKKKRIIANVLAIFFSGIGVYVANLTSQNNAVVQGILGTAVILLIFLYATSNNSTKTLDVLFVFPENLKFFAFAFFGGLVSYWSAGYVYAMFLYFVGR